MKYHDLSLFRMVVFVICLFMAGTVVQAQNQTQDYDRSMFATTERGGDLIIKNGTDLEQALELVQQQFNVVFLYRTEELQGNKIFRTVRLSGNVESTLKALLEGHGLEYNYLNPKTYGIYAINKNAPFGYTPTFIHQVTGVVRDANSSETLPGVNVVVKGTTIGTATDGEGEYSLEAPAPTDTLVFSFIGYQTLEVPIQGRATIDVGLQPQTVAGEELVVVGYGTQQRSEITGSVTSVRSEDLENIPVSSFEYALQGRMAGVNIATSDGAPGSAPQITIRGTGSITAGNQPLFVVDGVPISLNLELQDRIQQQRSSFPAARFNPLSTIDPNNIESIEVLKDAAATSIYGSRGSNGVVLITTKGGGFDIPMEINIRYNAGVQTVFNKPDLMSAEEHIETVKESRNNLYIRMRDPQNPDSDWYNPEYNPDTNAGRVAFSNAAENMMIPASYVNWDGTDSDWVDAVLEPGMFQSTGGSVRGGSSDLSYFIGSNYMNQKGTVAGSGFKRYALNTNLQGNLTDKFQLALKLNASLIEQDRKPANGPYFGNPAGIIYSAMVASPVAPIYDSEGNYMQSGEGSINGLGNAMTTTNHPLALRDFIEETLENNRLFGNLSGTYSIMENLEFKSMVGFDISNYRRNFYQGTRLRYRGSESNNSFGQNSSAQSFNWLWENTLNYNFAFGQDGEHRINAILGYTAQKERTERNRVVARNFQDDNVKIVEGGQIFGGTQNVEEWSLVSALGRVNYSLLDRYLLTATVRSDRSSRFGSNNQTGIFPSVSLGWRVTNEPFMQDVDLFNEIKPRISYGVTGNFSIPNYGSIGLVSSTDYVRNDLSSGLSPSTLGNSELTWETTREFNLGLDVAVLNDRFYGSFDYYISNTTDLLLSVNIPSVTGFRTILTNIGKVENKGFEFQITSRNFTGPFQWATDLSFSTNSNVVKELGPEGDPIRVSGAAGLRHITEIGSEIGSYWGYVHDGIYQTQEEIDNGPVDMQGDPQPGDIRWKDINNDGVIDTDDRTVVGSYHPDFQWGISNRFSWKNFDLSIFIQGVQGREILNLSGRHMLDEGNFNMYSILEERWRSPQEPGGGYYPKIAISDPSNNSRASDYLVEDGSYIKLKDIQLGYNIPPDVLGNFANRVHIYASVTNAAIWTDYLGWNPEVNLNSSSALTPGEDYGAYPLQRVFQFGIDVTL